MSLGLYIHLPWCVRKCPYCDFNSHVLSGDSSEKAYVAALLADLDHDLSLVSDRSIGSVFIGGGTPSLFEPDSIHSLLDSIAKRVEFSKNLEISLEANPGTVESHKFKGFKAAGINRLSIGIQSFNDRHLQSLGRIHDAKQATHAVELAKEAGFENFNLDLMFGLPNQTLDEALSDINQSIQLNPAHISFYQLTLEPNTVFYKARPILPENDELWEMQQACQSVLSENGYQQYEISAYAKDGQRCQHNLNYWRFGDYLGIGAGAHGKLTDHKGIYRYWKHKSPKVYLGSAGTHRCIEGSEIVKRDQIPIEFMMNHLRLREGFNVEALVRCTGLNLDCLEPGLSSCLEDGLLEKEQGFIRCTDNGWNFLDNVLERFL